jgi:hypothetical protein
VAGVALAGHRRTDVDPDLWAYLPVFFMRGWAQPPQVPDPERLGPDLPVLCARLPAAQVNPYRLLRFDP